MKAITLYQPWASLIMTGAKTFETRSWATKYRGPLVICSAKGGLSKSELLHLLSTWQIQSGLAPLVGDPLDLSFRSFPGVKIDHLPFGKALGVVDLTNCSKSGDLSRNQINTDWPYGDFTLGRYAWKLENVRPFDKPIPVIGRQGFFNFEVPK